MKIEICEYIDKNYQIKKDEIKKNGGRKNISESELIKDIMSDVGIDRDWTKTELLDSINVWRKNNKKIQEENNKKIQEKLDNKFSKKVFEDLIEEIYTEEGCRWDNSYNSLVKDIPTGGIIKINLEEIKTKIVANIDAYKFNGGSKLINSGMLINNMEYHKAKKREINLESLIKNISFEDSNFIEEYLTNMYNTLNITQDLDIFIILMTHFFWQIKRKIYAKRVINHLWIGLYGQQGTGKSTTFRKMFKKIFGEFYNDSISLASLCDDNCAAILNSQFLVNVEELDNGGDGFSSTSIGKLKKIMSNDSISYRQFFTQSMVTVDVNASIISTANEHLYNKLQDETGLRRFFEFTSKNKYQERFNYIEVDWLADNFRKFFRNIDENNDKGYWDVNSDIGKKITELQKTYVKENSFIRFLKENYKLKINVNANDRIQHKDIYQKYLDFCREEGIQQKYIVQSTNIKSKIVDVFGNDCVKTTDNKIKYCLDEINSFSQQLEERLDKIDDKTKKLMEIDNNNYSYNSQQKQAISDYQNKFKI